jgi:signal transduction histidine kinase
MPDIDAFQLTACAVASGFALLWATQAVLTARFGWRFLDRPTRRVGLAFVGGAAVQLALVGVLVLVPRPLWDGLPTWLIVLCIAHDWALLWAVAVSHQLAWLTAHPRRTPSPTWLTVNYLPAVLVGGLTVAFPWVLPGPLEQRFTTYFVIRHVAIAGWLGLNVVELRAARRPGGWRPGFAALGPRRRDIIMYAGGVVTLVIANPLMINRVDRWFALAVNVLVVVLLMLPLVARIGGEAVRTVVMAAGMLLVVGGTLGGVRAVTRPLQAGGLPRLADLILVTALTAVALVARRQLQGTLDRLLLGRRRRRWEALEAVVRTLPAEEGVHACCRRTVAAAVGALGVDGVAIVLTDGFTASAGSLNGETIGRVWAGLADHALRGSVLGADDLPGMVVEGLAAADVTTFTEVASGRRCWGHLFSSTRAVAGTFIPSEQRAGESVAAKLALVLDAAALVERTVGVERALADAEKLAAVGETAARIAHEIRNPVTAARSLAQLLVRQPESPRGAERAALILEELARVERQVAALLRFARPEAFRFAPVELDRLARSTLDALGPRLADAGVAVELDAPSPVVAVVDGEKLRQVLVNLIENAVDAMSDQTAPRRLSVAVERQDGVARLRVTDTGAGIAPDVLLRVFEPFFTAKPHGTGLGLAIAKHLIQAHGGRIAVGPAPLRGTVATVELPAAEPVP